MQPTNDDGSNHPAVGSLFSDRLSGPAVYFSQRLIALWRRCLVMAVVTINPESSTTDQHQASSYQAPQHSGNETDIGQGGGSGRCGNQQWRWYRAVLGQGIGVGLAIRLHVARIGRGTQCAEALWLQSALINISTVV